MTGSQGFVGSHLCRKLIRNGKKVERNGKNGDKIDVNNINQLYSIGDIEAIVHLAAKTSIKDSMNNPYDTYHTNLVGTLNLLELSRLKNIKRFIYVSTYVYGQPKYLPIDENHPLQPHSPYNKSKLLAEQLCKNYSSDFGIDVVTLRPFYLYGTNARLDSFIPIIIQQIRNEMNVLLSGKGTKRDFLFISDFVNLVEIILGDFPAGYNVFNIGYGKSCTLEQVAKIIAGILDKKINISYDLKSRPNDIIDMAADISRVSRAFDWKPLIDIKKGLELTVMN